MEPQASLGFMHFIAQSDWVARLIFAILVVMSIASWTVIAMRVVELVIARNRAARFLDTFWRSPSLAAVERSLQQRHDDGAFARLAEGAIIAAQHGAQHAPPTLAAAGGTDELVTRALRRSLDDETMALERGLTLLASVGSTAPFVGLFGTVWGIYHALVGIGMSGQGTLDKVAGPVGEALIMTAAGLAVAIPAVLAYNAFTRANRMLTTKLDGFAHDMFVLVTTGAAVVGGVAPSSSATTPQRVKPVAAVVPQGG